MHFKFRTIAGGAAVAVLAVTPIADAAKKHSKRHVRHAAAAVTTTGQTGETVLTGTTAQQASAAALVAVPGGTVDRASTETDGTGAYEVHMTKSDGSRVVVIEDASFAVLSTTADTGHGPGHGPGPNGPGNGEAVLTGTTAQQASAAALVAVPGGTVDRASTETDGTGAYEVHVTKSDGSRVVVIEDASFNVLSTTADSGPGGHGPGDRGPGGPR